MYAQQQSDRFAHQGIAAARILRPVAAGYESVP